MIQIGAQVALAKPSTPLSSPSQSPSEQLVTLNNVHQFIDMVKAVVVMEIASIGAFWFPLNFGKISVNLLINPRRRREALPSSSIRR